MAAVDLIAQLGSWDGYEVEACWEEQRGRQRWCVVRLRPTAGRERECSGCGARCVAIHDYEERRVRDLPIFEFPVELIVPRIRVACPKCGAWSCPASVDGLAFGIQTLSGSAADRGIDALPASAWLLSKLTGDTRPSAE